MAQWHELIVFIGSEQVLDSYFYKQNKSLGDYIHCKKRFEGYSSEDFEQSENILLKFFPQGFRKGLAVLV